MSDHKLTEYQKANLASAFDYHCLATLSEHRLTDESFPEMLDLRDVMLRDAGLPDMAELLTSKINLMKRLKK